MGSQAYTLTCSECGESFTAWRRDARYCSPRCRKSASRGGRRPAQIVEPNTSTPQPVAVVTDNRPGVTDNPPTDERLTRRLADFYDEDFIFEIEMTLLRMKELAQAWKQKQADYRAYLQRMEPRYSVGGLDDLDDENVSDEERARLLEEAQAWELAKKEYQDYPVYFYCTEDKAIEAIEDAHAEVINELYEIGIEIEEL